MTYAVDDQCCVTRDTHSHSENHGLQRPSALLFNRRRHTLRYAIFTTLVSRELSYVRANPSVQFSRDSKKNLWIFSQIFNEIFYFQVNLCDWGFQENFTTLLSLSDSWFKFQMANSEFPERLLASPTLWNSTFISTLTRSLWKIHYFFNILGNIRVLRKTFHFLQIIPAFSQLLFVTSFKKRFPFLEIVSYNCIEPFWYDTLL